MTDLDNAELARRVNDVALACLEEEQAADEARLDGPDALTRAARWYAAVGVPVFPLHNLTPRHTDGHLACSCDRWAEPGHKPAKHPRTAHGLNDATTDPLQVAAWWQRWPQANIGLRTGVRFDVIDIDGPPGYRSLTGLRHQQCPPGCCDHSICPGDGVTLPPLLGRVQTPRGAHLYIAATGDGNTTGILPGIDYRGTGGYVVAPPSVGLDISGRRFRYAFTDPLVIPLPTRAQAAS